MEKCKSRIIKVGCKIFDGQRRVGPFVEGYIQECSMGRRIDFEMIKDFYNNGRERRVLQTATTAFERGVRVWTNRTRSNIKPGRLVLLSFELHYSNFERL